MSPIGSVRTPLRRAVHPIAMRYLPDRRPLTFSHSSRQNWPAYDIRLRNDDGLVGALRLQDLLADELAMRMLDLLRLATTHGGNGDAWMRVSDLISRMHDRSRGRRDSPSIASAPLRHLSLASADGCSPTHRTHRLSGGPSTPLSPT